MRLKWQSLHATTKKDDGTIRNVGSRREATVDDLYHVEGKAEIVNGELVLMSAASDAHGYAALEVVVSLHAYAGHAKTGRAVPDNVGFIVNLPHRRSFSPDAAFHVGRSFGHKFIEGAPVFAVEVRSDEDNGPEAERAMAAKRADYFAVGTRVVWDVDIFRDRVVRVYRTADPLAPTTFRRGERADAEPAVPGWSMRVDDLLLDTHS
jgi:Uma2 family endonuclease